MTLWMLLVASTVLLAAIVARPKLATLNRPFGFVALFALPLTAVVGGLSAHVDHSKTVAFCTSCHVMEQYGKSLHNEDLAHLPAAHFINGRVPQKTACYACHTQYTVYGDFHSKLRGLRHVYMQYIGRIPAKIELYSPYHNRECLYCHEHARPFEDAVTHRSEPDLMAKIRGNQKSCLSKGCHDVAHDVANLDKATLWPAKEAKP